MDIASLHAKLAKVAPVEGVSIGDPQNKSTWVVRYGPNATEAQKITAEGIVTAYDPASLAVPASVKMWQAKAALQMSGKLEAANAKIAELGNQTLAIAWAESTEVSRDSVGLNMVAAALGMSDADVDALFITAAAIKV